jgi:hypothetical protein
MDILGVGWMKEIKDQESFYDIVKLIEQSRKHVFTKINQALVELYWEVGKYITSKIESEGWGKSTIKELSEYIILKNPEIKGFTPSNIWRMKQFYETYSENKKLATLWRVLPWSQNRTIFSKCKTEEERVFYLNLTAKNKLSVRDLEKETENPSIGILLCRDKDDEVVEYSLSRSLSPTVVSEYKTKLIPKEILRAKMNELYELLERE